MWLEMKETFKKCLLMEEDRNFLNDRHAIPMLRGLVFTKIIILRNVSLALYLPIFLSKNDYYTTEGS